MNHLLPWLFRAIGTALLTFSGVTALHALEPAVRILPLGDSLTSGVSYYPVQGAYRNPLHTLLGNVGYNVDFVGTFSDTSNPSLPDTDHQGQGGARIDQLHANLPEWLGAIDDPDVVLLLAGTNDFWQDFQLGTIQTRITNLITEISTRRPFAKILLANLPLRTDDPGLNNLQISYNSTLAGIVANQNALGRQVSLVDVRSALTASDLSPDGVHPTAAGFAKMAAVWSAAINSVTGPLGDPNPPVIARLEPITNSQEVTVVFSKPLADNSADLANFSISDGLAITSATLDPADKRSITLTTGPQTPGLLYSLSVTGVRDRTPLANTIAPQSMAAFSSSPIINGSFENDYAGWTPTGNQQIKTTPGYLASDGVKLVAFNSDELTPNGTLSQTFPTTPGQAYQLSFDLGTYSYSTSQQRLGVTVQGASTLLSSSPVLGGLGSGITRWVAKSFDFVADSTSATLTFRDLSSTTNSIDLLVDNVRIGAQANGTLAVTSSPLGGTFITLDPPDISGNAGGTTGLIRSYSPGATVTATAPASAGAANFLGWRKNGVDLPGASTSITLTMDGNHSIDAVYESINPPVAAADTFSTPAGTPLIAASPGVLANDSDADGDPITAVPDTAPVHGSLSLNSGGGFTYTPDPGFTGDDSFTYHATDGTDDSATVAVTITVYPATSQLIVNGSFEADLDAWTDSGNVMALSGSPFLPTDGAKLAAFNAGQSSPDGMISQSFGTVPGQLYQLAFDLGALSFNTSSQRLLVNVDGNTNLLSETRTVQGPGGGNTRWLPQFLAFTADSPVTTLSFTDTSATSNSIDLVLDNVRVIGPPPSHTLTVDSTPVAGLPITVSPADLDEIGSGDTPFTRSYADASAVTLTAPATSGNATFVKWQLDGADFSTTPGITVTIDTDLALTAVFDVNTAPSALADNYSTPEDTLLTVAPNGVLANDSDPESDPLTAVSDSAPANGTLNLGTTGGFTYQPDPGFTGADSFTYHATDGSLDSDPVTVTITVTSNTPGALANGSFEQGDSGWSLTGNYLIIDSDAIYTATDGSKLVVFNGGQTTPNARLTQTLATTVGQTYLLSYDLGIVGGPATSQALGVSVQGTATHVSETTSITGAGTTTAAWQPLSHTFTADSALTTITFTDQSPTTNFVDLLLDNIRIEPLNSQALNVTSIPANEVSITVDTPDLTAAQNGQTSFTRHYQAGTAVTLTAPATNNGTTFVKWMRDGAADSTNPAITLTMDTAHALTAVYAGGAQLLTNGSFEDGYTGWTQSGNQLVSPVATATDGAHIVELNGSQLPATALLSQSFPTVPGKTYQLDFDYGILAFNNSTQSLRIQIDGSSPLLDQTLTIQAPGTGTVWYPQSFSFVADADTAILSFRDLSPHTINIDSLIDDVRVTGTTGQRLLTIVSTPESPVPLTISPADLNGNSGGATTIVRDYPNQTTVNLTAPSISGSGTFLKWLKNGAQLGTDPAIAITMDGDHELTAVYTSNQAPLAANDTHTLTRDIPLEIPAPGILQNDSDPESDTLTATPVVLPIHGSLSIASDGGFTYTPDPGYLGTDSFTYQANDGIAASNVATVHLEITAPAPGILLNGSFESDFTSWQRGGGANSIGVAVSPSATDGDRFLQFNGSDTTPDGTLSQTIATTPGAAYQLSFDLGLLSYNTKQQLMRVRVTGASTLLTEDIPQSGHTGGTIIWNKRQFTFTADSTSATLSFSDISSDTKALDTLLDNVRLSPVTRILTVDSSNPGTAITVAPADLDDLTDGTAALQRNYDDGTVVTLTAPPSSMGGLFDRWTRDGADLTTAATATFTIDSDTTLAAIYQPNTPPVCQPDGYPATADQTLMLAAPGILGNDSDAEFSPLTAILADAPSNGTLALAADGGFTYTPDPGFVGNDSFTYQASDGFATSAVATVQLEVTPPPHTIIIDASPSAAVGEGGSESLQIAVSPDDLGGSGNGTPMFTRTYHEGTSITVTAPLTSGPRSFSHWQKDGSAAGSDPAITLTIDSDITLVAVYEIIAPPTPMDTVVPTLGGSPGAMTIGTTTLSPGSYVMETSPDLKTWTFHSRVEITESAPAAFQDNDPVTTRRFYRIYREE